MRLYVRYPRRNWMPVGNMDWRIAKVTLDSRIQEATKQGKYGIIQLLRQEAHTLQETRKERMERTRQRKRLRRVEDVSRKYRDVGLWFHWLPEMEQKKLLDMSLREVKRWFEKRSKGENV